MLILNIFQAENKPVDNFSSSKSSDLGKSQARYGIFLSSLKFVVNDFNLDGPIVLMIIVGVRLLGMPLLLLRPTVTMILSATVLVDILDLTFMKIHLKTVTTDMQTHLLRTVIHLELLTVKCLGLIRSTQVKIHLRVMQVIHLVLQHPQRTITKILNPYEKVMSVIQIHLETVLQQTLVLLQRLIETRLGQVVSVIILARAMILLVWPISNQSLHHHQSQMLPWPSLHLQLVQLQIPSVTEKRNYLLILLQSVTSLWKRNPVTVLVIF